MRIEKANAKINVYLDVVSKRDNGYHNIVSIMHTVSLCDLVSIGFLPGSETSISLSSEGISDMPTDAKNLAWRAASSFLRETGLSGRVSIHIEKNIPMAAGLAGGSADAAAVLRGMNTLCGNLLSVEALCALGTTLGADVPFCIRGGSALVTGIGDEMADAACMPMSDIVIACMGDGVSTPWAYGALDEKYSHFSIPHSTTAQSDKILHAWEDGDATVAFDHFFNIFEQVVPSKQPYVERIKREMYACGALKAMMSGSGPSVFGIFSSKEAAVLAQEKLEAMGARAFVCTPTKAY
ncbi:MAG: 4-(cytidine 5'-diphospho)-2-C-methyl-D-erythritol kinase [Ruminococcaceae bacterium]|nr:4-(cytidine 5'-diphospho)-2-C-methyl-D-erythritol kinase [Oscillospiraceae bacterium]